MSTKRHRLRSDDDFDTPAINDLTASVQKLAIFTGELSFSVRRGIREILDHFPTIRIHVLIHQPKKKKTVILKNQLRNLRKHGPAWIPHQIGEAWERFLPAPEPTRLLGIARSGGRYELESLLATGRVEATVVPSVNGAAAQRVLQEFGADLGLSLAAPILKSGTFMAPRLGTINLHKGKLPDYRGMPPAFWEMMDGCSVVGCTVHKVDAALDTGPIIVEATLPVHNYSTPKGLRIGLDDLGNQLVVAAIRNIVNGTAVFTPQHGSGRTNTRPPLRLERKLQRRHAAREGTLSAKRRIRDAVFLGYSALHESRRLVSMAPAKPAVVIMLYHRVSDEFRDGVSIGVERFDEHMAYLRRHWPVVPLRSLVCGEIDYAGRQPLVCITFDDGYRDNYECAAPILLKHRLPATFFVSTGKISNQGAFDHDLEKLGRPVPVMTWEQARTMQRDGLDFGSHTANHVNLGKVSIAEAWSELVDSREALRRELGQEKFLFAYPFGRKQDVRPETRGQVKEAGYDCLCSAYGGINSTGVDAFNLLRVGVNYNFSIAALRSRLNGWD